MKFTLPPPGLEALLMALVLGAAVYDVRYRRIPNWLNLLGILAGIGMNTFLSFDGPDRWSGLITSLEGMALGFGVYFLLYMLRAMGAGDVKLMAAVGAVVGPGTWFGIFIVTAIVGGVMAMLLILVRKRFATTMWNVGFILSEMKSGRPAYVNREELDVKNPKSVGLPHGAVIAVGCIFYLALALRVGR
jgi:prepilin peptidase CpaA